MDRRTGLNEDHIRVLEYYASTGNRELYWNYLAQQPGVDNFPQLALGVVRNDNMPGATANAFAQNYAWEHDHKRLTERQWDEFGVDLIKLDLSLREQQLKRYGRPDLALNLPARDVQLAHDLAFHNIGVDPNAWTPRQLLEAARQHETEEDVQKLWTQMLDNDYAGMNRAVGTLASLAHGHGMSFKDQVRYTGQLTKAVMSAADARDHVRPDIIGDSHHYYMRDRTGAWSEMQHASPNMSGQVNLMNDVRDAEQRRELEDTWQLRQERARAHDAFFDDDPGRRVPGVHPLAQQHAPQRPERPRVSFPQPGDDAIYALIRNDLPMDISDNKVAEVVVAARRCGLRTPEDLAEVTLREDCITFSGRWAGEGEVSLETIAPPREHSFALIEQLDASYAMEQQHQQQLAQQQGMDGPVMSM